MRVYIVERTTRYNKGKVHTEQIKLFNNKNLAYSFIENISEELDPEYDPETCTYECIEKEARDIKWKTM